MPQVKCYVPCWPLPYGFVVSFVASFAGFLFLFDSSSSSSSFSCVVILSSRRHHFKPVSNLAHALKIVPSFRKYCRWKKSNYVSFFFCSKDFFLRSLPFAASDSAERDGSAITTNHNGKTAPPVPSVISKNNRSRVAKNTDQRATAQPKPSKFHCGLCFLCFFLQYKFFCNCQHLSSINVFIFETTFHFLKVY